MVTIGTQIAFDPATCESTYLQGTYAVDKFPSRTRDAFISTPRTQQSMREAAVANAAGTFYQSLSVQYRDPVRIVVTETYSSLKWFTTGSCVTSTTPGHDWTWFTNSGWSRTGSSASAPWACTPQATSDTTGTFKNTAFPCPGGGTTYTNHSKTLVVGYPTGTNTYSKAQSKSGACNNLLHSDYVVFN